jgi:hypothetical protein
MRDLGCGKLVRARASNTRHKPLMQSRFFKGVLARYQRPYQHVRHATTGRPTASHDKVRQIDSARLAESGGTEPVPERAAHSLRGEGGAVRRGQIELARLMSAEVWIYTGGQKKSLSAGANFLPP